MLDKKFDNTEFPSPDTRDFVYATAQLTYDHFKDHPNSQSLVNWFSKWFDLVNEFLEKENLRADASARETRTQDTLGKVDIVCERMGLCREDLKAYLDSLDPKELSFEESEIKSLLSGE